MPVVFSSSSEASMVKILIVYYSKSGNTEKMARAVAAGADQVEGTIVEVRKTSETNLEDLQNANGIIIGSPTYYGLMAAEVKKLLDESVKIHGKLEGKVGGAFASAGGYATGAETTLISILQAMLVHGMIIQGRSDNRHYGAAARGAPELKEIEDCQNLGKRVASLATRLHPQQSGESGLERP